MLGKLVGISGPVKGRTFALDEKELSFGRDLGNTVTIKDSSLSRYHCKLTYSDGSFILEDLKSHNGTVVNEGKIAGQFKLRSRDRIFIGRSAFVFLVQGDSVEDISTPGWTVSEEGDAEDSQTTRLALTEAVYTQPPDTVQPIGRSTNQQAIFHRLARDLDALLRVSTAISTIRDREALFTRALELVLDVTRAEHGAVLQSDDAGQELRIAYKLERGEDTESEIKISGTLTRQVANERVAILSSNLPTDPRFSDTKSLLGTPIRSIICVPIVVFDRMLGLFYIDTNRAESLFTDSDLKLVTAIVNQVAIAVDNIGYFERLQSENRRLTEQLGRKNALVGESPDLRKIMELIRRVAKKDSTVLITGESGTGKELIARAIHQSSPRCDEAFIPINCAAIPENLIETELFGHEKGAFTGAVNQRKGKLETADNGTVFLDEIGELPLALQAKLLRVLQEREFQRLGGNKTIKINVRILAATNRDLEKAITTGSFREDLFYRLNVVTMKAPALRDRREDILPLAEHFLGQFGREMAKRIRGFSDDAKSALLSYSWPGNVRELQNAIEHAAVLGESEWITATDLPERVTGGLAQKVSSDGYHETIKQLKRRVILNAISEAGGNLSETAKVLKLNPTYLSRLIKVLEIQLPAKSKSKHS